MSRLESHHLFWTKNKWNERPISKQVRGMATYIISLSHANHRLLHASLDPPEVPDIETLRMLRENASMGLESAIGNIKHKIVEHIGRQLLIASIDEEEALDMLDRGNYPRYKGL